jgi:hypothetical protein
VIPSEKIWALTAYHQQLAAQEAISIRPMPGQVHRFDAAGQPMGRQ